ncbi:MAG: flagellar export chaperone FliS [Bryobacterales bacterium]|nr:flagellar export chaperone FliS [Bryobacterales bacterium]
MTQSAEQVYLESKIYTATPGELVQILYETSLEAVHHGIEAVERGDIEQRARSITKATSCIMELAGSLNVEAGGELGVRLAVLYEYLLHELLEANVRQTAGPLRDCERVLHSLLDGWTAALAQLEGNPVHTAEAADNGSAPTATLVAPSAEASADPGSPIAAHIESPFGVDSDDPDPFDIEELEPVMHSWSG